ncbi:MAG: substrate-binding domain-containing protein [Alphaproteobacteria bacterium]|nr:substrate-binding domain-containing protein [Alphaproteobacteria bacterium SS10]
MKITRRHMGFGLLAAGIGGTAAYSVLDQGGDFGALIGTSHGDPVDLWGFIGGEKSDFVRNPEITRILDRTYGINLDARRAGSVEMVRDPGLFSQRPDFLWPSSAVMVQMARQSGVGVRRDQVIFNSPIVIYSWLPIAQALVASGIAEERAPDFFVVDPASLIDAVTGGKAWSALGIDQLFGQVIVSSTDPTKSNSGFMFAGLVANLLSGGVATPDSIGGHLDTLDDLFERMGYKEHSSGKLWDSFLNEGMGGRPMVVGYENQLIEFVLGQPEAWARIKNSPMRPVTLYPEPTVYSAHPLISLNEPADRLIAALEDDAVQSLAWSAHGFRGKLGGAGSADLGIAGVPQQLNQIAPMPDAAVMMTILERLSRRA